MKQHLYLPALSVVINHRYRLIKALDSSVGDHGGHLIASMFGGPGEGINIVAMNAKFNGSSGEWYKMEQVWQKALDSKKSVKVKIEPIYSGNSKRPDSFDITQVIGDKTSDKINLKNTETGK